MPTLTSTTEIETFVYRRIRRDWHRDIEVIGVTEQRKGLFSKSTVVEIACRSRIACEQARISLAPFAANDSSDWKVDHWRVVKDRDHLPYRLDLIELRSESYS